MRWEEQNIKSDAAMQKKRKEKEKKSGQQRTEYLFITEIKYLILATKYN